MEREKARPDEWRVGEARKLVGRLFRALLTLGHPEVSTSQGQSGYSNRVLLPGGQHSPSRGQSLRKRCLRKKIVLQIVDENKQVLQESDTYNFFNYKVTQQDPVQASEEIIASFSNLGARDLSVRVILMAQSKQKWAGFHGPRFSNEMVSIQTYEK
jgi:hypothetical protein